MALVQNSGRYVIAHLALHSKSCEHSYRTLIENFKQNHFRIFHSNHPHQDQIKLVEDQLVLVRIIDADRIQHHLFLSLIYAKFQDPQFPVRTKGCSSVPWGCCHCYCHRGTDQCCCCGSTGNGWSPGQQQALLAAFLWQAVKSLLLFLETKVPTALRSSRLLLSLVQPPVQELQLCSGAMVGIRDHGGGKEVMFCRGGEDF